MSLSYATQQNTVKLQVLI